MKKGKVAKQESVLSVLKDIRAAVNVLVMTRPAIQVLNKPIPHQVNDRFTDNGDGTITDNEQRVTWVKDPQAIPALKNALTWSEAKEACERLSFAGYNGGWRMPTLKEEQSIRDYTKHDPAWDTAVFAGKFDNWYWTSTECAWDKSCAWCVHSYLGDVLNFDKDNHNYVRPVRSSQ